MNNPEEVPTMEGYKSYIDGTVLEDMKLQGTAIEQKVNLEKTLRIKKVSNGFIVSEGLHNDYQMNCTTRVYQDIDSATEYIKSFWRTPDER